MQTGEEGRKAEEAKPRDTYLHTGLRRISNLTYASRNVFSSLIGLDFDVLNANRREIRSETGQ